MIATDKELLCDYVWMVFVVASAGLHHDSLPASLLERRAVGVSVPKQPEQDVWLEAREEDLGSWRLLRPLQALLHPRHHHGEHHAAGLPRRKHPLQRQVQTGTGGAGGREVVEVKWRLWAWRCSWRHLVKRYGCKTWAENHLFVRRASGPASARLGHLRGKNLREQQDCEVRTGRSRMWWVTWVCFCVFQGHCDGSLLHGLQQLPSGHTELLAGAGELWDTHTQNQIKSNQIKSNQISFIYIAQNHNHIASVGFTICTLSDVSWEVIPEGRRMQQTFLESLNLKCWSLNVGRNARCCDLRGRARTATDWLEINGAAEISHLICSPPHGDSSCLHKDLMVSKSPQNSPYPNLIQHLWVMPEQVRTRLHRWSNFSPTPRGVGSGPLGVSCGVWHQAWVAESSSPAVWEVGPPWTGLVLAHPTEASSVWDLWIWRPRLDLFVTLLRPFMSSFAERCTLSAAAFWTQAYQAEHEIVMS